MSWWVNLSSSFVISLVWNHTSAHVCDPVALGQFLKFIYREIWFMRCYWISVKSLSPFSRHCLSIRVDSPLWLISRCILLTTFCCAQYNFYRHLSGTSWVREYCERMLASCCYPSDWLKELLLAFHLFLSLSLFLYLSLPLSPFLILSSPSLSFSTLSSSSAALFFF